jgi:hybrid cluster-associated redox disulfide protein
MKKEKRSKKSKKITINSNLAEVVYKYPKTAEVLTGYGLHCVGCFASAYDTIKAGAKVHGLSDGEIKEMVERINEVIKFGG